MLNSLRNIFYDDLLRTAWWRVVRLWRPMALWTFITWGMMTVILSPLFTTILGWQFLREGKAVIGNQALLEWLISPGGLLYLVLFCGLAIVGAVIHFAGLFQIVTNDLEGRPAHILATALQIIARIPSLVRLCLYAAGAGVALLVPLFLVIGAGLYALTGGLDLVQYLQGQPESLKWAVSGAAIISVGWLVGVVVLAGRSILALPAYLDGYRPIRKALSQSWEITSRKTGRILRVLFIAVVLWVLIRLWVDSFLILGSYTIISKMALGNYPLRITAILTGFLVLLTLCIEIIISFMGFSHVSTLLCKLYYEDTSLHTNPPVHSGFGKLTAGTARMMKWVLLPHRLVPISLLLIFFSLFTSGWMLGQIQQADHIAVIAHRGGPAPAPDNTLAGLQRSIELGADYAEIDVQQTSDSMVVAVHDADLERVAGKPFRIAETPFSTLHAMVKGEQSNIPPDQRRVESLGAFLKRAKGEIGLIIELKYYNQQPVLADSVVAAVKQAEMTEEVRIMSMNLKAVKRVQHMAPNIQVGYVAAYTVGSLEDLPFDFLAVNQQIATNQLVDKSATPNNENYIWTINDRKSITHWMLRGADGIITDEPAKALKIRQQLEKMSTPERLLLGFQQMVE